MIRTDLQTFRQTHKGGNVTGVIYLELHDGAFPETGWSDFPVIILGWWADALLQLEESNRRKVQWSFMDGPQSVTLIKMATGSTDAFDLFHVHSSLLEVTENVIAHCDQHAMATNDLEALRVRIGLLKANKTLVATGDNVLLEFELPFRRCHS